MEALDVRGNVKIVGDATITNATVGVLTITEVAPTQIIGAGVSIKSGIVTAQGTGIVTFLVMLDFYKVCLLHSGRIQTLDLV